MDYDQFEMWSRRQEGVIEGYRGERFIQSSLGRIGAYRDGLFYIEGRASALAHLDERDHDLLPVRDLQSAELAARDWMREHGAPVDSQPAKLGRIDLASELRFANAAEGSAFLHSLAALDVPWCKSRVDGRKGDRIETVSFHGTRGRTIYLRAYDKGVEAGTDPAGLRIRVERQKRFRKEREPVTSEVQVSDLRRAYLGREFEKLADLPSATCVDLRGSIEAIYERAATWRQAEYLAGFAVLGHFLQDEIPTPTWYRRLAELRSIGVFIDPTQVKRLEVPVGRYLQTLGSAWAEAA